MAVGLAGVHLGERIGRDADLRVEGSVAPAVVAAVGERCEGVAQEPGVAVVEHPQGGHGLFGVVELCLPKGSGMTPDFMACG